MTGKPIVDVKELADVLGVSIQTIRNWVRSGLIPPDTYIKAERTYRFVVDDVVKALRAPRALERAAEQIPEQLELPLGTAASDSYKPTKKPIAIYNDEDNN
jgi:DNA-binding transcriptional MerR regulator